MDCAIVLEKRLCDKVWALNNFDNFDRTFKKLTGKNNRYGEKL
jgi:hypothetical protein